MSSVDPPIKSNGMRYSQLNQIKKEDWPSHRERGGTNKLLCAKSKQENMSADKSQNICSTLIEIPQTYYTV